MSWLHEGNQLWYIWVGQADATISAISAFDLPYLTYNITHALPLLLSIGSSLFTYLVRDDGDSDK